MRQYLNDSATLVLPDHLLKRYREDLLGQKEKEIERQLAEYEHDLREQFRRDLAHVS